MAVKVKLLSSLTLLVFLFSGGLQAQVLENGNPEDLGFNVEKLNRIEPVIRQAMEDKEIPGAVVLVARKGKVVYREVFGIRSLRPQREALTLDTVFDMASMTKVMAPNWFHPPDVSRHENNGWQLICSPLATCYWMTVPLKCCANQEEAFYLSV